MDKFLLIADSDWTPPVNKKRGVRWYYSKPGSVSNLIANILPKKGDKNPDPFRGFMGAVLAVMPTDDDLKAIFKFVDAYRVVILDSAQFSETEYAKYYFKCKQVRPLHLDAYPDIINWVEDRLYDGQQGTKLDVSTIEINPRYKGEIKYDGFNNVTLDDDYGDVFKPLVTFKWQMYIDHNRTLQLWPEYVKDDGVELRLIIYEIYPGNDHSVDRRLVFDEEQLKHQILIENTIGGGLLNAVIEVKGKGRLTIGQFHYRWSRLGLGEFFPGGERLVDKNQRQELDFYFNPGDMKPPLNVYFSGWRSAEGFEAFYMMRSFGAPFILIADPRLAGGQFYMSSEYLENLVVEKIQEKLAWLGFTNDQLNLSGISMGTMGALYYGVKMNPHAILIDKPVISLGTVARNEQKRFGVFPTSLDVLNANTPLKKAPINKQIEALNKRFWDRFDDNISNDTKLIVGYKEDDDYDLNAIANILQHLSLLKKSNILIKKGFPGHHGDGVDDISWFKMQYKELLKIDFGRGKK